MRNSLHAFACVPTETCSIYLTRKYILLEQQHHIFHLVENTCRWNEIARRVKLADALTQWLTRFGEVGPNVINKIIVFCLKTLKILSDVTTCARKKDVNFQSFSSVKDTLHANVCACVCTRKKILNVIGRIVLFHCFQSCIHSKITQTQLIV